MRQKLSSFQKLNSVRLGCPDCCHGSIHTAPPLPPSGHLTCVHASWGPSDPLGRPYERAHTCAEQYLSQHGKQRIPGEKEKHCIACNGPGGSASLSAACLFTCIHLALCNILH